VERAVLKGPPTLSLPRKGGGDQNTYVSESVSLPLAGRGQGWGYSSRAGLSTSIAEPNDA